MNQTQTGKTRGNLVSDFVAGLTTGLANIPDAMASALLAGANPVQGLYAIMIGTPLGAIFGSSAFMTVCATSALAITAGIALAEYSGDDHARALSTLALLTGIILVAAGLLKLGRLIRFVSNSVLIGFLTGVSITIVLSQLGDFTGYSSEYSNKVMKAVDLFFNLDQVNPQTTAIGLLTVVIILFVDRTRLGNFSMLIGMVAGSAAALLFGWSDVQEVGDIATIPSTLPMPTLPDLALIPVLALDALSLAIIALVQGAGVSKAYPNPDGNYPNTSRDFIGQGAANLGAGFLQGMPIGGSVSSTALNVSSGAKSRWANIISGLVVVVAILVFGPLVSLTAIPAMAGLLILAGIQSLKREEIADVWATGWASRAVMLTTLALTLIVPLQYAVLGGVVLSVIVFLVSASNEVRLVQFVFNPDGTIAEQPAPKELPNHAVTILQIYGSLFFAGASQLQEELPSVQNSDRPVVILRLRPYSEISSTFINVIEDYAGRIKARNGKLILTGVGPGVHAQLERTETIDEVLGAENIYLATGNLGFSTRSAVAAAETWLAAAPSAPATVAPHN